MKTAQSLNKNTKHIMIFWLFTGLSLAFTACTNVDKKNTPEAQAHVETPSSKTPKAKPLSKTFSDYWYAGEAEIASYSLEQARYGEIRKGQAVLIYVTEDFLPDIQVKADRQNSSNISVLKLNTTKNFNTGIYPYSIMQSTFYPVSNVGHALKVSSSIQEWCGQVYTQLNHRDQFEITSHSYFEGEADENFKINTAILENELWTQLRIDPKSLPIGDLMIIPSFEFARLKHLPIKAYNATASLTEHTYTIAYPKLQRTLSITFNASFPFDILSWEETFQSGFGANAQLLTTKATKIKTIKSAYWNKKYNKDAVLRDSLQLH